MSLIDDFKARFPEFDTAQVDAVFPSISATYHCYYNNDYGVSECEDEAILQLCAHLFVVQSSATARPSREVSSRGADGLSVSYGDNKTGDASFYSSTKYGQAFLLITSKKSQGGFYV